MVASLCAWLQDVKLWESEEDDGWAPIHALHVLGAIGSPDAIPAVLSVALRPEPTDPVHEGLACILARFGPAVIGPATELLRTWPEDAQPTTWADVVRGLVAVGRDHPEERPGLARLFVELLSDPACDADERTAWAVAELATVPDPEVAEAVAAAFERRAAGWVVSLEELQSVRARSPAWTPEEYRADPLEWFSSPEEGLELGSKATGCLLEWEWRVARSEGCGPLQLLEDVRRLDTTSPLHCGAVRELVATFDEAAQQEILAGLEAGRDQPLWADVLARPHGGWFGLYRDLAARHAPDRYEALALENLAGDWRLALPLVAGRLERGEHAEAAGLCERAMGHRLRLAAGESWDPRISLVVRHAAWRSWLASHEAEEELLEGWRQAARGLADEELAGALEVQLAVVRHGADGDAVHGALSGALAAPGCAATQERLFGSWRSLVADHTLGRGYDPEAGEQPGVAWVTALVDAAWLGPPEGRDVFVAAVRGWLVVLDRRPAEHARPRQALATPTLDLDPEDRLQQDLPRLREVMERSARGETLARTRRGWVTALGAGGLLSEVLDFWTRHAPGLVPDPARGCPRACAAGGSATGRGPAASTSRRSGRAAGCAPGGSGRSPRRGRRGRSPSGCPAPHARSRLPRAGPGSRRRRPRRPRSGPGPAAPAAGPRPAPLRGSGQGRSGRGAGRCRSPASL